MIGDRRGTCRPRRLGSAAWFDDCLVALDPDPELRNVSLEGLGGSKAGQYPHPAAEGGALRDLVAAKELAQVKLAAKQLMRQGAMLK
jgi:hypothetical protein